MMAHPTATRMTERMHGRILPTTAPRRAPMRPVTRRRRRPGGSFTQQLAGSYQDDGEYVQQGSAQAAGKGLPASPKMEEMVSHGDRVVRPARRRTCLRTIFSLLRRTIAAARRAPMGQLTSSTRVERRRISADQDVASD